MITIYKQFVYFCYTLCMNDQNTDSKTATFSSLRFHVSNEMLVAEFTADSLNRAIDTDDIVQLLENTGFGKHQLKEDVLFNLVEHSKNNHRGDIPLEIHTDASFELKIANDQLSATLIVNQAQAGEDLNYDEVLESLLEASIKEQYIDNDLLLKCLTTEYEQPPVIASGLPPVNGEDSKFEVLFNAATKIAPQKTDGGNINHYETHEYITVTENQPVMKRIPHTAGTAGITILGETVSAENGAVIKFTKDDTVKVDKAEPNLLIAAKKGHPVASENGVHIDDTLTIKDASLKSGNIHFDGSVQITGEVMPNVVVEASGDIFVHGMVEGASLIAGNNITINSGILNTKLFDHNSDDDFKPECVLEAKGTIIAKYCHSICATAKKDILIETYSMHSQVSAGRNLIFGNNNGKGVTIGGTNYGQYGVSANFIGSDAYVKTNVSCGALAELKKQQHQTENKIKLSSKELALLEMGY